MPIRFYDIDLQVNMDQMCFPQHWSPSAFYAILDSDSEECLCLFRAEKIFVCTKWNSYKNIWA